VAQVSDARGELLYLSACRGFEVIRRHRRRLGVRHQPIELVNDPGHEPAGQSGRGELPERQRISRAVRVVEPDQEDRR